MAWVLLLLENQGQDKRVESILVPCLDAGSNPAISTKKNSSLHPSLLEGKEFFFVQDAVGRLEGLRRNPDISQFFTSKLA